LIRDWRFPWFIDILFIEKFEFGNVPADEEAFFIPVLREGDGRVAAKELGEKGGTG